LSSVSTMSHACRPRKSLKPSRAELRQERCAKRSSLSGCEATSANHSNRPGQAIPLAANIWPRAQAASTGTDGCSGNVWTYARVNLWENQPVAIFAPILIARLRSERGKGRGHPFPHTFSSPKAGRSALGVRGRGPSNCARHHPLQSEEQRVPGTPSALFSQGAG